MEFKLDLDLIRGLLAQERGSASREIRDVGVERALALSQSRHDIRIAAAPDAGTLACRAGCTWCCYFTVDVRAVEVFRILDVVEQSFSPAKKARVLAEVRANSAVLQELDEDARVTRNLKCPFLAEGRCTIYAARPQSCRNYHSTNVAGCQQTYEHPDDLDIDPDFAPGVYQAGAAHVEAFSAVMRESGFDDVAYELNGAIEAAISDPADVRGSIPDIPLSTTWKEPRCPGDSRISIRAHDRMTACQLLDQDYNLRSRWSLRAFQNGRVQYHPDASFRQGRRRSFPAKSRCSIGPLARADRFAVRVVSLGCARIERERGVLRLRGAGNVWRPRRSARPDYGARATACSRPRDSAAIASKRTGDERGRLPTAGSPWDYLRILKAGEKFGFTRLVPDGLQHVVIAVPAAAVTSLSERFTSHINLLANLTLLLGLFMLWRSRGEPGVVALGMGFIGNGSASPYRWPEASASYPLWHVAINLAFCLVPWLLLFFTMHYYSRTTRKLIRWETTAYATLLFCRSRRFVPTCT